MAWETIEHAGADLKALAAARTGVYIGAFTLDNLLDRMGADARFQTGPHTAVGSTATILSNRISHAFDLKGPSLSVDTACSSSLVAFHLACQAIWQGDCEMALAGGVNVMFRPEYVIAMSKGHFLAPDGRSKTFDATGDGYGRGEGAGVVLVKSLARARAEGDRILAVVRATGCNQDGRTDGITVPNGQAQAALISDVLERAGLAPADIDYVEAHGTGTVVGDPIETGAIGSVLGTGREHPLAVGSVKANIGHLEAASGMAGLIKLVLMLRERQVPPVAGLNELNPRIDFAGLGLAAPRSLLDLPAQGALRMAINSFGYGGTNAHVIVESPPARTQPDPVPEGGCVLPLSARSEVALGLLVEAWVERLEGSEPVQLLAATAAQRRSHHPYRVAFSGPDRAALQAGMEAWLRDRPRAERTLGDTRPVFVFTGMGPQWWGMARELLTLDPDCRTLAAEFDQHFQALAGFSLLTEMLRPERESRLGEPLLAQTGNLLCQMLVTRWLEIRGIRPAAVVGHSVGEVGSAWAAGTLSLEAAVTVGYQRARLQASAAGHGGMLAVGLSEADAQALLPEYGGRVEIAAVNGPAAVTLAGDEQELDNLAGRLEVRGVFNRRLRVEVAYHSRYMDPILEELQERLADLEVEEPRLPTWSTVTAREGGIGLFDADYWCRNVREPVRFRAAIEGLLENGYRVFLEIGPHSVLGGNLREIFASRSGEGRALSTLSRGLSDLERLHETLCRLYAAGVTPDWQRINGQADAALELPRHPWLREILWREQETPPLDTLLGPRADSPEPAWVRPINTLYLPWVADHVVDGLTLLPGAVYVDTFLTLAGQRHNEEDGALRAYDIHIQRPLVLDGDATAMYRADLVNGRVTLSSRDEAGGIWTQHAAARIDRVDFQTSADILTGEHQEWDVEALYRRFEAMGLSYGPACRRIRRLQLAGDRVRAELAAAEPGDMQYWIHPTVMDGAFQSLLALVLEQGDTPWVPTGIESITVVDRIEEEVICLGRLRHQDSHEMLADLQLQDGQGRVLAELEGLRCVPLSRHHDALPGLAHREIFVDLPALTDVRRTGNWLVLNEDGCIKDGQGETLAQALIGAGVNAVLCYGIAAAHGPMALGAVSTPEELTALLTEDLAPLPLDGVAYLADAKDTTPEQARMRVLRVHALVRALAARAAPPRLYLLSRDAQAVQADDPVHGHGQAAMLGYGRVAHTEFPDLGVSLIDHDGSPASLRALAAELLGDDAEDDLALRGGQRLGRRVTRVESAALREEALARTTDQAAAVMLEHGRGYAWREADLAEVGAGQVRLALHRLVREETSETGLCGFLARVEIGTAELEAGTWIAGAATLRPASHLLADPASLCLRRLPAPLAGAERWASLWAPLHACLSRLAMASRLLLLFSGDTAEGRALQALAPVLGITRVILADDLAPRAGGLARRVLAATDGQTPDLVVFCHADGLTPQPLALDPAAQVVCLGTARQMDTSVWLAATPAAGVHRPDPIALFRAAPALIAASLARLALETSPPEDEAAMVLSADEWAALHAPVGLACGFDPLPEAIRRTAGRFDPTGCWIITGGFGGFGLACAEWLARRGADELILLGRTGARGEAVARLERLRAAGAVREIVNIIGAGPIPLAGVLHAAGVLADQRIEDMSEADLDRVMIPKLDGAWNLGAAMDDAGMKPRHFILFSSIAATVNNSRQANYVAANLALDAFAARRRARGLAADCVAWGALGFGMGVSNEALDKHFQAMGITPLTEAEALAGLERVLEDAPGALAIARVDWPQYGRFDPHASRSPKLAGITGKDQAAAESPLKR